MKLTDITNNLIVEERKLSDYLLNPSHPDGCSKARFLGRFGFSAAGAAALRESLLTHASTCEVSDVEITDFGDIYRVTGPLDAPDGRQPFIHAVWEIRTDTDYARLVTLIPVRGEWQ